MDQDTSEIRHEVEQAREELGQTVEALMYKANAPSRLKHRLSAKIERIKVRTGADRRIRQLRHGARSVRERVVDLRSRRADPTGGPDAFR